MLKAISIILVILGFILLISYQKIPDNDKVEGIFMTNKQKRYRAMIMGYGFILLGAYLIIKNFLL